MQDRNYLGSSSTGFGTPAMSGAHAPLLDGFPHGHAGMGEVHNGLLVGVSTFQPARTHWAFFAYVVMLSCFAVYIFADLH